MVRLIRISICVLTLMVFAAAGGPRLACGAPQLDWRDGDRVVLLGGTLIEREQKSGWWEALLTAGTPDAHVTFRNLGWDGDTVWAESRGIFDPPDVGYQRMLERVGGIKPTVIVLGYGRNESFAGEEGLPKFIEQYERLLDDLAAVSAHGVRFVLLTPVRFPDTQPPLPDPRERNRRLEPYARAVAGLGERRGHVVVDLYSTFAPDDWTHLTSNGLHLNEAGYRQTGILLARRLGSATPATAAAGNGEGRSAPFDQLRQAIIEKNRLYFHSWRPQNVTYLFGFRKHEQGQNAAEVAEFEKLVAARDQEIQQLKERLASR